MSARSFGRKGAAAAIEEPVDEMASRRAAFVEAERKRSGVVTPAPAEAPEPGAKPAKKAKAERPAAPVREARPDDRRPAVAYPLLVFMGLVGAHRHYLGLHVSALIQSSLFVIGMATILVFDTVAFVALGAGLLWLIGDAFALKLLCRSANERSDQKRAFAAV